MVAKLHTHKQYIWPLGVTLAWMFSWLAAVMLAPTMHPFITGSATGATLSLISQTKWRKAIIAIGFPMSYAILNIEQGSLSWLWLTPVIALLAIYPPRLWADAPMFPTSKASITGLARRLKLPCEAKILDAGCGFGHAIEALASEYPKADMYGSERSSLVALIAKLKHKKAHITCENMWQQDWSKFDLVYVFHRPDTMPQAMHKALEQLKCGAWLASLEFKDDAFIPDMVWHNKGEKPLYLYQSPIKNTQKIEKQQNNTVT